MHINNGSNFKIIVSEVHKGIKSQIQSNLYLQNFLQIRVKPFSQQHTISAVKEAASDSQV